MHATYEQLARDLASLGVVPSNMFGMPVLKWNKRPLCGLEPDGVMFKLKYGSELHAKASALSGAHPFQPVMKNGRAPLMKEWIVVPFEHQGNYLDFAMASFELLQQAK